MGTLLVKNADTIVTCDDADSVFTHANLLAKDGVITYVGPTGATASAAPHPLRPTRSSTRAARSSTPAS